MAEFPTAVQPPGAASYSAPLLNFSQFLNWPQQVEQAQLVQQQQQANQQQQQINQQRIAQGQQQAQLAQAFPNGLPTDPKTGAIDYGAVAKTLAKFGDVSDAVTMLHQQPPPLSPMFGGQGGGAVAPGGQPGPQPASVPAKPLPPPAANAPQGDSGTNTITSLVTDKLPSQNQTTGATIGKIAEVMGLDPNADLTPGQIKRAQGLLQKYAPEIAGPAASRVRVADAGGSSPSFADRFAAASPGGGNLPPSANAGTPAPQPAPQRQGAPNAAGAPAAPSPQGQPQAPAQAQTQPQANQPIVPQVPLPIDPRTGKQFTDPQQAAQALRNEAARLSSIPKAAGQVDQLNAWADRIDASQKPVAVRQGETLLDPRTARPIFTAPTAAQARNNPEVVSGIVDGITSGKQPPKLTGLYSLSGPVRAELDKQGFDLSKAQLEYSRAEKQVAALNGPQMTRFVGLATSVDKTIDEVRELSEQMGNSGIPLLNKAKLEAYIQAEGNSENGQLATRYLGAVNTLKEEFANLAQGGYAPTEPVWALANRQINENYGVKQMGASLEEIQRLIRYRVSAIPGLSTMGPGAANRYTGQSGQAQPASSQAGPTATHIEALKANPARRDEFDAKFGAGAAAKALGE